MSKYKNLKIIGTSHISKESVNEVEKEILANKPDLIALELDSTRFKALISKKNKSSNIAAFKTFGLTGFFLNLLGSYVERSLSKYTGSKPGAEMKKAIKLAGENKIRISLIDQPIQITIKKLTSQLTRKEKLTFIKEFIFTFFSKKQIKFDLNKVPSHKTIQKLLKETKQKYPTVYRILVTERNTYMAKILNKLMNMYPKKKILAIVGAGHEKEIIGEIKSIKN